MANPRYNTQVANRRGAMKGGRMKKMGGGMMMKKRSMLKMGTAKPNGSMKSAARSMKAGMKKGVGKLPEGLRKFLEKKKGKK